jgi:outer membrane protein assembly factor BamB
MNCCPHMRRFLVLFAAVTLSGAAAVLAVSCSGPAVPSQAPTEKEKGDKGDKPDDKATAKADKAGEAAHDWPMFGGTPARDMVNTAEKGGPTEWDPATGKNIKWVVKLGSKAYGGPIIAGGHVYVGTNNDLPRNKRDTDADGVRIDKSVVVCLNEADGAFLWQAVHDKLAAGRVHDWPGEGICSSPTVEGDRLWYVSNRCEVVCATTEGLVNGKNVGPVTDEKYKDKTDADVVWKYDMIGELGVFPHNLAVCSPLVIGDVVYVVTANGVDEGHIKIPKPQAPSFIALDKKTGKLLWKKNYPTENLLKPGANLATLKDMGLVLMHGQWSNPAYAEVDGTKEVIFPGGDGWLYGLNPTNGDILWKFDANPKDTIYKLGPEGTRSDFVATPVVHDGLLYIGTGQDPEHDFGNGQFWCIDLKKATKTGGDVSPELPVKKKGQKGEPNPNSAAAWGYGGYDDKGDYKFARTLSTASVHDGLCFVADIEGSLYCFDAKSGELYWQDKLGKSTWCSPYTVDGKVYIGSEEGKVFIFKHGKKKELINTIDMKGKVRVTPVVANGTLYVMTENKLYAIGKK